MSQFQYIDEFAQAVVDRAKRELSVTRRVRGRNVRRVSTGSLRDSLTYSLKPKARSMELVFGASGKAKKYADIIEEGRRPNSKQPPVEAIEKWMRDKPVRLRGPQGGFIKESDSVRRAIAKRIARSIGIKGIEGIKYFETALTEELELRGDNFEKQLINDLNIFFSKIVWQ